MYPILFSPVEWVLYSLIGVAILAFLSYILTRQSPRRRVGSQTLATRVLRSFEGYEFGTSAHTGSRDLADFPVSEGPGRAVDPGHAHDVRDFVTAPRYGFDACEVHVNGLRVRFSDRGANFVVHLLAAEPREVKAAQRQLARLRWWKAERSPFTDRGGVAIHPKDRDRAVALRQALLEPGATAEVSYGVNRVPLSALGIEIIAAAVMAKSWHFDYACAAVGSDLPVRVADWMPGDNYTPLRDRLHD